MPYGTAADGRPASPPSPRAGLVLVQLVGLASAAAVIAATANDCRWRWPTIAVLAAFAVFSELTAISVESAKIYVSGTGLSVILAAVLLGGGPAAVTGLVAIACGRLHTREPLARFLANLATFAWFPLLTGLFFHTAADVAGVHRGSLAFYLLAFAAYLVLILANFLPVALFACYEKRLSPLKLLCEAFVPLLPAHLFSALLGMGAVYLAVQLGTMGIAVLGIMFVVFQYLIGELLKSRQRSRELQRMAATDELTGLANRDTFRDAVEERIAAAGHAARGFAVLLMDLDRFKEINDTLGHHYGDVLLRDLGPRLVQAVGRGGLVARLGGDEFAVLPAGDSHSDEAVDLIARRLTACVAEPFTIDELALEIGSSIGVARFPDDGRDAHSLLRCADIAMYAAKDTGADYKVYEAEHNQHTVRRLSVIADVRNALQEGEIVVHFQPIVDLRDVAVRGAEALVRWQHPDLGLIPPAAFVNTVEQTGLIGPLTRHVLECAIADCAVWRRDGSDLSVAVNLSVRNLLDRDLPREIERLLAHHGLPPEALQLEITESMIMSDPERAIATVGRLSDLGVRMSVDDFGTGYSSLANLRRLPIVELKIDRSFVSPMLRDESDLIIVRSTINMGHDLGLRIIAEGVEDRPTLERLAALDCDQAQGYHISRPLPREDFLRWLGDPLHADGARSAPAPMLGRAHRRARVPAPAPAPVVPAPLPAGS